MSLTWPLRILISISEISRTVLDHSNRIAKVEGENEKQSLNDTLLGTDIQGTFVCSPGNVGNIRI